MVTVTKHAAAKAHIRGALRSFREGDLVCALTLAGAAEDSLPPSEELTVFQVFKIAHQWINGSTDKEAGTSLNEARNWLKHFKVGEPLEMDMDIAGLMLFRAISKYAGVYGMDELTDEFNEFLNSQGGMPTS